MIDVRKIGKKVTTVSELMIDRVKGDTENLIKESIKNDAVFTIDNCDYSEITKEDGTIETLWVYTLQECEDKFFFAGFILEKFFNEILKAAKGDYDEVYESIRRGRPNIKYGQKKTREGNMVTTIEFI